MEEVEEALRKERNLRDRQRLKAIRLGILGQSTMEEVAGKVGVSRATVGTWAKNFRAGGMAEVLRTAFEERGRKGAINAEVQEQIRGKLAAGDFKRAKELRSWLRKEHGIELGLKAMYYWLGKVGGVLKVPRKTHARKDAAAAQAFKVELADRLEKLGVPPRGQGADLDGRRAPLRAHQRGAQGVDAARTQTCGYSTAWRRLKRWSADGTLLRIWRHLLRDLDALGEIDWSRCALDGSYVKAKKGATKSAPPEQA